MNTQASKIRFGLVLAIVFFATVLLSGFLTGCSSDKKTTTDTTTDATTKSTTTDVTAKKVTLNKNSLTIAVQAQLTATVDPTTADQNVTWSTSDDKVATVDDTGMVKAKSIGEVEIVATSVENPSDIATCKVKVVALPTSKDNKHEQLDDDKETVKECMTCHD